MIDSADVGLAFRTISGKFRKQTGRLQTIERVELAY
jgi:hypothetical protein